MFKIEDIIQLIRMGETTTAFEFIDMMFEGTKAREIKELIETGDIIDAERLMLPKNAFQS